MSLTRYVVRCQTGYKSSNEKVSIFTFPKEEVMRDKWINAVPRKKCNISTIRLFAPNILLMNNIPEYRLQE